VPLRLACLASTEPHAKVLIASEKPATEHASLGLARRMPLRSVVEK